MAYSTSNPPALREDQPIAGRRHWNYESADAIATVRAANYITNAKDLGMKVLDRVTVFDTATPAITETFVITVSATGADLADGTTLTGTNT
jgi:ABC-type sulfate transport system substrate-binding protein